MSEPTSAAFDLRRRANQTNQSQPGHQNKVDAHFTLPEPVAARISTFALRSPESRVSTLPD
jgi:hypothetical protein